MHTVMTEPAGTPRRTWPAFVYRWGFSAGALIPCIAFFGIFAFYPMVRLLILSVSNATLTADGLTTSFAGLKNFRAIAGDHIGLDAISNTLVFMIASVTLSVSGGTILALLVNKSRLLAGVARRFFLTPMAISPIVVGVVWALLLNPGAGTVNKILPALGLPSQEWLASSTGAMIVIIAMDVWHWTPLVFLLVYTGVLSVDQNLIEAARIDGASEAKVVYHVIIPVLAPILGAAVLLRIVMTFRAFDEMYLLTGGGPGSATTLVSAHVREVFFDQLEFGYGAAYSVAVIFGIVVVLGLVVLARKFATRSVRS